MSDEMYSRSERILRKILGEEVDIEPAQSRVEELLIELLKEGYLPDEKVEEFVRGWLDDHPEAVTGANVTVNSSGHLVIS